MNIHNMTTLVGMPDAGMLLGHSAPRSVLDSINARFSGGGVNFGSAGDTFASAYSTFQNAFVQTANATLDMLKKAKALVIDRDKMVYIVKEEDLESVPPSMYGPILTYEPIRNWHLSGAIDGWGVDPQELPDEDPYHNTIHRGYMETDHEGNFPKTVEWVWTTDDIDLSPEECDMVMDARRFIENFVLNEQRDDTLRDPTGYCDGLLLGELR